MEDWLLKELTAPALIILCSVLTYLIIRMIIKRLLGFKHKNIDRRKQKSLLGLIMVVFKVFIFVVALVMILDVYGIDTRSLVTSLGVASLVIGLALQDLIRDFIVGFAVLFEDQYYVGDVVTINGFMGTVSFIGLRTTRIKAANGEVKIISNRSIIEVSNHSLETHKSCIDVNVASNTDIEKVRLVLDDLCEDLSNELQLPEKATCVGVEAIGGIGIQIRIIIPSKFADRMNCARIFRERIKLALDREGISIAYPQVVMNSGA